jgi:putative FmdB family regulatory protein
VPVYEYTCEACGPFELWRPVLDASAARLCPTCDAPARRRFTPPAVARTSVPLRAARDREDRSAHAPDVVRAPSGRALPWQPGHAHGAPWTVGH